MIIIKALFLQKILGLTGDIQLDNAYCFLGLRASATMTEVTAAFRQKSLLHHPDKGGDTAAFQKLNAMYLTIKEAREK